MNGAANPIDAFHERVSVESAVLVADVERIGYERAAVALHQGILILQGRLRQVVGLDPDRLKNASVDLRSPLPSSIAFPIVDFMVARTMKVPIEFMHVWPSREQRYMYPQQVAMYVAYSTTLSSLPEIAAYYHRKCHTSVSHGRDAVAERWRDGALKFNLDALCVQVREALAARKEEPLT